MRNFRVRGGDSPRHFCCVRLQQACATGLLRQGQTPSRPRPFHPREPPAPLITRAVVRGSPSATDQGMGINQQDPTRDTAWPIGLSERLCLASQSARSEKWRTCEQQKGDFFRCAQTAAALGAALVRQRQTVVEAWASKVRRWTRSDCDAMNPDHWSYHAQAVTEFYSPAFSQRGEWHSPNNAGNRPTPAIENGAPRPMLFLPLPQPPSSSGRSIQGGCMSSG